MSFKKKWLKKMYTYFMLKNIFTQFSQKRDEVIVQNKKNYTVRRVALLYRRYTRRIAFERVERTQKRLRDIFAFSTIMTHDIIEEKSKHIIRAFLHDTSEIFQLKTYLRKFHNHITFIQSKFREHLQAYKMRCQVLSEIWDREKQFLVKSYILKKNKKKSGVVKKLNLMSDEIKQAMIKAYLERCKIKYQLTFADWRMHTKFNKPD